MATSTRNILTITALAGAVAGGAMAAIMLRSPNQPDAAPPQEPPADTAPTRVDYPLIDVAQEWGIDFVHNPGPPSFFFPAIVGSGVALLDLDQDGRLDLYIRTGTSAAPHPLAQAGSPQSVSRLFRQVEAGRFADVTEQSGLIDRGYGMGVAVGDVNNDGFPDVYSVNVGGDRLFVNRRDGTFQDVTATCGIGNREWGSSATFLDFDRDGRLDLFVTNYVDYSHPKPCMLANGREDFCNPSEYLPTQDKLYRNVTDVSGAASDPAAVRFEDVSGPSGIAGTRGPGLGVRAGDFDDDGWPDLFVANDGRADFMWMNQRNGTLRELGVPSGAAYNSLGRPTASMGITEGDIDHDQRLDLMITNLRGESNTLFRKLEVGFSDSTAAAGLKAASYPHTGFGIAFADVDHDGNLDLLIANGHVYQPVDRPVIDPRRGAAAADPAAVTRFWSAYADTSQLLRGDGQGRFSDVSAATGTFGTRAGVARSLAMGDLDDDGDLDVVITQIAGPARVLRNDVPKTGHWVSLRVVDPARGGRDAYGAVVTIAAGDRRWLRRAQPGSSYQSSDDPRVHCGLGEHSTIDWIEVRWPDGPMTAERFPGGPADEIKTLRRGDGEPVTP